MTGFGGGSGVESLNVKVERVGAVEVVAGVVASAAVVLGILSDDQWGDLSTIGVLSSGAVMVVAECFRRKLKQAMRGPVQSS